MPVHVRCDRAAPTDHQARPGHKGSESEKNSDLSLLLTHACDKNSRQHRLIALSPAMSTYTFRDRWNTDLRLGQPVLPR